jgi:hypothetical protein
VNAAEALVRVVDALDRLSVPYMVVGAFSSLDLLYIRGWCDQHRTREIFEQLLNEELGTSQE